MENDNTIIKSLTAEGAKKILVELVKVPSPQTKLLEREPLLSKFIRTAIEPRLRDVGVKSIRYDGMQNLIATYGEGISGKSLMFIGNAMNQPKNTMENAYKGCVKDGKQFGLPGEVVLGKGASEQKANLAAMLQAIEYIVSRKIQITGKLIFICCVSGESGRHDAIANVIEKENVRADMAILGGSSLKITLGNRGRIDSFISVSGSPCHSSSPSSGCNAVTGAVEILRRLERKLVLKGEHPHLGRPSFAVNHIRSFPDSTHTIQNKCEITLDRRLLPGDNPEKAWSDIENIVMQVHGDKDPASNMPWQVEFERGPFMYPSLVEVEAPIVQLISNSAKKILGKKPEVFYTTTAFDQGYLNHLGIPCVNYGCGEDRFAHTNEDCASVDRTRDAAKVYAEIMESYLGVTRN